MNFYNPHPRASLAPFGMPIGMDPREWRHSIEQQLEEMMDRQFALITLLDMMDVDPDFEPDEDGEPWLATCGGLDCGDDRELTDEDGGDVQDEPHDEIDEGNAEPDIGWSHHVNQLAAATEGACACESEWCPA